MGKFKYIIMEKLELVVKYWDIDKKEYEEMIKLLKSEGWEEKHKSTILDRQTNEVIEYIVTLKRKLSDGKNNQRIKSES